MISLGLSAKTGKSVSVSTTTAAVIIQSDQNFSVPMMITIQSSGAQGFFNHRVYPYFSP